MDCCAKCAEKSDLNKLQTSRKFNHGNVNEPIPDNSHIFGGKWYHDGIKKWSPPPSEIIEFALAYQKEARGDFIVEQPNYDELASVKKQSLSQEMPRAKKIIDNETAGATVTDAVTAAPVKRARKPKVAGLEDPTSTNTVETPKSKSRKPKVAPSTSDTTEAPSEPKKRAPRKKAEPTPYSTLVNTTNQLVHKEVSLPTHIESKLDEVDIDGYRIEYVKLSVFEVGQATYFRDTNKNKLYKKIKEKGIGAYVGRWNPETDSIVTDIPDSDDEN
jgi:hypothetical protein